MKSVFYVIECYEHMIKDDYFNLASTSKNSILTILNATQVSKGAALDNLFRHFLKNQPIDDLCNLSVKSETFPDSCKAAKLKPLNKEGSFTQPCNYRPISLLTLISKVIDKFIFIIKLVLS